MSLLVPQSRKTLDRCRFVGKNKMHLLILAKVYLLYADALTRLPKIFFKHWLQSSYIACLVFVSASIAKKTLDSCRFVGNSKNTLAYSHQSVLYGNALIILPKEF
jgi:hypothetical protein